MNLFIVEIGVTILTHVRTCIVFTYVYTLDATTLWTLVLILADNQADTKKVFNKKIINAMPVLYPNTLKGDSFGAGLNIYAVS